jgi:DNA repair protein SbcC/Rad50
MRPLRLDLAGFAVFREATTIDFTDADFFALVGATGSGKSTVLDAICFALYGTVPRWGDRRAIANALAPSATEGRVRLVFASAGVRYVLTRVVRRDTKGGVTTRQAGLEALPIGFDLSRFDGDLTTDAASPSAARLGEVLAGTPGEVDVAVADVVGLPYEQFTKCVVLPQGEFAAFLHAKPAERQKILVNLLGLEVYGRVRERATTLANEADAQVKATDGVLAGYADADAEARRVAAARVAVARTLAVEVDRVAPKLADAQRASTAAREALAALDAEVSRLGAVRRPKAVDRLAAAAACTRAAASDAAAVVTAAEEREEKLRAELSGAGDPVALRRLLDAHAERGRVAGEAGALGAAVADAEREHDVAERALAAARADAAAAEAAVEEAREAWRSAMATDRAVELRSHLRLGEPCPLCVQPVAALPPLEAPAAAEAAKAAGEAAGKRAKAAARVAEQRDRVLRELDRGLAGARAQASTLAARLAALDAQLDGAPSPAGLEQQLAALDAQRRGCEEAATAVRRARTAARSAVAEADAADAALRAAWRDFDATRDGLAQFGPPPADRGDLAEAWTALGDWATTEVATRQAARVAGAARVESAEAEVAAARSRIVTLFMTAGVTAPADDFARAAAVAVERAEAAHRRVEERVAEAARLRAARASCERDAQVARALAGHLRADRFERWLLAEALDALVEGASRILRELSGGQYDLGHDKGEFFVVDHHDAGLRRAVRTLSGGETFQASLAFALALSDQLAGLSTGVASLESIVLDEGFGTLDAATLDTVAATLENLAARGDRMVGVVTHVAALAERIPVRFEVTRDARTARVERLAAL